MSHVNAPKDIHIHMVDTSLSSEVQGSSNIEDYVIQQNKLLTSQISKVHIEKLNIQREKEELERDVDRMSSSLKYLKGIVKNFQEINDLENTIHKKTLTHVKRSQDFILWGLNMYSNGSYMFFCIYSTLSLVNLVYNFEYFAAFWYLVLGIFFVAQDILVSKKVHAMILPSTVEKNEVETLQKKLKTLKDSQNFLSEYVDSI